MRRRTSPIWSRWELSPPAITVRDAELRYRDELAIFRRHRLVKPTTPATEHRCKDCGEHQPVTYMTDREGSRHGFIVCQDCGPAILQPDLLDQVVFDTEMLLSHLFGDARLAIKPIVSDRLWQIGRQTFKGRSRELLFLRGLGLASESSIFDYIAGRPRSLVFTPLVSSAGRLAEAVSNPFIGFEEVVEFAGNDLRIDWDAIEDRLGEARESEAPKAKPQRRRSTRVANIELLVQELTQHLRSAVDHARSTGELLPRPTQLELGRLTEMSKSDVSRCISDPGANQLRLLWQTADDLDAILRLPSKQLR